MFASLRHDIQTVLQRDPAARHALEVLLCYPGVHALCAHRLSHRLWQLNWKLGARCVSQGARFLTGIEIHPAACIGRGVFIDHGMGVVIGETAEVGDDATIYHGVTLGGTSLKKGKRHPTLGNRVIVGAGASVLGAITVGDDSRIGANSVVVKAVPPNAIVVGVPGQIVARSRKRVLEVNIDNTEMPDTVGVTLVSLLQRVEQLEAAREADSKRTNSHPTIVNYEIGQNNADALQVVHPLAPTDGIWRGEDFSI